MSVPAHVVSASMAAFDFHDPSVPVLHLVGDSLIDEAVSPGEPDERRLLFEGASVTAEVLVTADGSSRRLRIQVVPADYQDVTLLHMDRSVSVWVRDSDGVVHTAEAGLTSLLLGRSRDRAQVRTAWVRL